MCKHGQAQAKDRHEHQNRRVPSEIFALLQCSQGILRLSPRAYCPFTYLVEVVGPDLPCGQGLLQLLLHCGASAAPLQTASATNGACSGWGCMVRGLATVVHCTSCSTGDDVTLNEPGYREC